MMEQPAFLTEARFLLVDDEQVNITLLEQMLAKWGCLNVVSTTESREAAALYGSFAPDIILLDLMMPELDGFGVLAQLAPLISPRTYLPILVLTADTTLESKRRALAAGATDFLTKPFDAVELSLRVRTLLQTRGLQQELSEQARLLEARVWERTQELARAETDAMACLALAAEFRDDDTGQHTQRVGRMAALLAQRLNRDSTQVGIIRRTAPLHDVGKIGVPDSILLKPGKLSEEEFALMRQHTEIGARILSRHHSPLMQEAAVIALCHHERWDGTGYPRRLAGEAIPLEGRIVALADVFDALTHERPYKAAWPVEEALAEIGRQAGRQFDPTLVGVFLELARRDMVAVDEAPAMSSLGPAQAS